jgi:CarD family transcriptional regulator
MYTIGELIIYGNTGVCRVTDITELDQLNAESKRYYVLSPLYQNGVIYTPIDNTKVFMRSIISTSEAEKLINTIPSIEAEACHFREVKQLTEHYETYFHTYNCKDLVELTMSIYKKKELIEQQNRKLGAIDAKYMKRAEDLLFGELAAALSISVSKVPEYIDKRICQH